MGEEFSLLLYNVYVSYFKLYEYELNTGILTQNFINEYDKLRELLAHENIYYERTREKLKDCCFSGLYENFISEIATILGNAETKLVGHRLALKTISFNKENLLSSDYAYYELKNDYFRTVLYFLNKYLHDSKYADFHDFLLKMKYKISFLFPDIEENLLDFDMQINPHLFWLSESLSQLNDINREEYENLKTKLIHIPYSLALSYFLKCHYPNLTADEQNSLLISNILLRSSLMFLDEKEIAETKNLYQKMASLWNPEKAKLAQLIIQLCDSSSDDKLLPNKVKMLKK